MKFSVFQVSRQGGRERNEDRMGYAYTQGSSLFVLADGMGGHPEGAMAAQLALQTMAASFRKTAAPGVGSPPEFLTRALMASHHQIIRYAAEKGMLDSPRTTLVATLLEGRHAHWIHCGDSRLYLVRDGQLVVRTRDHSYIEQQASLGRPVEHINRNILFTCLGAPTRPVFDVSGPVALRQGDRFLLCSDGLWGNLKEHEIVHELSRQPLDQAVPEMVEQALRRGGASCDNVTALAVEWDTQDAASTGFPTASGEDSHFQSTIQADLPDTGFDDLDEEAIERSIAEINEAIRRTAERKV